MATKKTEGENVVRISWSQAANKVVAEVNSKSTLETLAEKADAMFVAGGGESKVRAAKHHVKRALETAEQLGVLKLTRPTDIVVERIKK